MVVAQTDFRGSVDAARDETKPSPALSAPTHLPARRQVVRRVAERPGRGQASGEIFHSDGIHEACRTIRSGGMTSLLPRGSISLDAG